MGRRRKQEQFLQRTKLFFAKAGLFENFSEGSRWQRTGMHCYISLSSIWMAQNLVTAALSYVNKPRAERFGENLTGGIGHREYRLERSKTWLRRERSRPVPASHQSTLRLILVQQRGRLRCLGREWSSRESEYERSNNPETQVRLWAQEGRSNA